MTEEPKFDEQRPKSEQLSPRLPGELPKTASLADGAGDAVPLRVTRRLGDVTNNKCPNCSLVNRVGVLVCENCGTSLIAGALSVPSTRALSDAHPGTGHLFSNTPESASGSSKLPFSTPSAGAVPAPVGKSDLLFEDSMVLRLEIIGATIPILVYPKKDTLIGRRDVTTGTMPDVDLTSYAGYRMGVSRRHAMIRLHDKRLEVIDLGSSNGSSLNGVQMQPHQPYPLRNGDELMFGKMKLRVIYQNGTPSVKPLNAT